MATRPRSPADSSRDKGTTTAEALLGVLSLGPMTGYEIRQQIKSSIGNFWGESFGQIYPTLANLKADGLIAEAATKAAAGDGRGTRYALTTAGRRRLRQWLGVPARERVPRNEVLLKLFFGPEGDPADARAQLLAARTRYGEHLARYEAIERHMNACDAPDPRSPYWAITLAYGIAEARALVAWADESLRVLESIAVGSSSDGKVTPTARTNKKQRAAATRRNAGR